MKFALIGHPVSHSFSAQYLNSRFQNEDIDAYYELIDLPDIDEFIGILFIIINSVQELVSCQLVQMLHLY